MSVDVTRQATQATNSFTGGTLGAAATVNVTGPSGTAAVLLFSGATTDDVAAAFNSVSFLTGVAATKVDANTVNFNSSAFGSAAKITFSTVWGSFNTTTPGTTSGTDAQAMINGQAFTGSGSTFTVNSNQSTLEIAVNPTASGTLQPFTISGSGLTFVLGENPASSTRLGLPVLNTAALGGIYGTLNSISSGGSNSLISGNATAALNIINYAHAQASAAQASLGGFEKFTLVPSSANVAILQENVTSALDAVDGIDVATLTAKLANRQLLQQATLLSLEMFSQQRQSLLRLLTGLTSKT